MKLSGEELRKIRETLRQAFPAATERLRLVVSDADIGTDFSEYEGNYESRIQTLLEFCVSHYRLTKLLEAAVKASPDNPELSEIVEFVEKYFAFLPRLLPEGDPRLGLLSAEKVLFKNLGFQNVREWLGKLDQLTGVVCRIEPQPRSEGIGGYGSGFLVGPDVILTNDHVASGTNGQPGFWDIPDRAAKVRIRFDCEYTTDGEVTEGKEYKLAADYQILRSPPDELDFALLKLDASKGRPSEDMIRGKRRGVVIPVAYPFKESEPLLILQHPQAEPMKLALGALTPKSQWQPHRIAYTANTEGGSSGSPCLTQNLDLGAIHHVGSNTFNVGVLMSSILEYWNQRENKGRLIAAGLQHLFKEGTSVQSEAGTSREADSTTPMVESETPEVESTTSNPRISRGVYFVTALAGIAVAVGIGIKLSNPNPEGGGTPEVVEDVPVVKDIPKNVAPVEELPVHALSLWKDSFEITAKRIPYSSPDNTFQILEERLNNASKSILIGMYEFTAPHLKDLVVEALKRGVRVSILINAVSLGGSDEDQEKILQELKAKGAEVVLAPRGKSAPFFYYHAKVLVIDEAWTLVQSANFSMSSVPPTEATGNRETGIAVESKELARHFTNILEQDLTQAREWKGPVETEMQEQESQKTSPYPIQRFPIEVFDGPEPFDGSATNTAKKQPSQENARVLPVLVPGNYLEIVPQIIAAARESIDIQVSVLRTKPPNVKTLLDAIKLARDRGVRVRFIMARPLVDQDHAGKELADDLPNYGLDIKKDLRLLSVRSGSNCNSKLIVVDGRVTMVGSSNWTQNGLGTTRGMNLLIDSTNVARYFAQVFEADWAAGDQLELE